MMQSDWHPTDIIARMKKRGTSLSALSHQVRLASSMLENELTRRWLKGERLIAETLDIAPEKSDLHAISNIPRAQPRYGSCLAFRLPELPQFFKPQKQFSMIGLLCNALSSRLVEMLHDLSEASDVSGRSPFCW